MQGEQHGGEPGPRHVEPPQDAPDQQARQGVQNNVYDVVTGWIETPEPMLDPVRCPNHRPVVDRFRREPHAKQAILLEHEIRREIMVIPDETGPYRRHVG